jgi:hypothetical protein
MTGRTIRMRHLCMIVVATWVVGVFTAFATKNIQNFGVLQGACFLVGGASGQRIAFSEVPLKRLWLTLGLPLALALYSISGDILRLGMTVSWALIALSFIAGGRAANLLQMLQQRT